MVSDRKKNLDKQDLNLFQNAAEGVERLEHDKASPFRRRHRPVPLPPNPQVTGDGLTEDFVDLNIETHDVLEFVRPGIQKRLFQELRQGHLRPDDGLDLHGLRVAEARPILAQFLANAHHHRMRVVHIIHGKGYGSEGQQPILKQKINQWLRQHKDILAFCSAPRFDGGTGAVYVLLSRKGQKPPHRRDY